MSSGTHQLPGFPGIPGFPMRSTRVRKGQIDKAGPVAGSPLLETTVIGGFNPETW